MNEVETKILEIDADEVKQKILSFGAELVYDEELVNHIYRKKGFKGFFRIRERGQKVFTTLKIKHGADKNGIKAREEREHEVSNVEEGQAEAEKLGFAFKTKSKKHRAKYALGQVSFIFDTVPGIPTYLEIESDNETTVVAWVEKLGFTRDQMCSKGGGQIMKDYGA